MRFYHTVRENGLTVNCSLIFKPKRQFIVHLFSLFSYDKRYDIKDLIPVRGQDGKISDTQGKDLKTRAVEIFPASGLQRGSAELETNRNLSRECLRFFCLALLPVFDSFSH